VLVGPPGPEEGGERHVDDDQRPGDEGDLAAEEAKAAVDVLGEDRKEAIDDASPAHEVTRPLGLADWPARHWAHHSPATVASRACGRRKRRWGGKPKKAV